MYRNADDVQFEVMKCSGKLMSRLQAPLPLSTTNSLAAIIRLSKKWKVCRACKFCKIAVKSSLTMGRRTSYAMIVLQHKIKNDGNKHIGRSLDRESAVALADPF